MTEADTIYKQDFKNKLNGIAKRLGQCNNSDNKCSKYWRCNTYNILNNWWRNSCGYWDKSIRKIRRKLDTIQNQF